MTFVKNTNESIIRRNLYVKNMFRYGYYFNVKMHFQFRLIFKMHNDECTSVFGIFVYFILQMTS